MKFTFSVFVSSLSFFLYISHISQGLISLSFLNSRFLLNFRKMFLVCLIPCCLALFCSSVLCFVSAPQVWAFWNANIAYHPTPQIFQRLFLDFSQNPNLLPNFECFNLIFRCLANHSFPSHNKLQSSILINSWLCSPCTYGCACNITSFFGIADLFSENHFYSPWHSFLLGLSEISLILWPPH